MSNHRVSEGYLQLVEELLSNWNNVFFCIPFITPQNQFDQSDFQPFGLKDIDSDSFSTGWHFSSDQERFGAAHAFLPGMIKYMSVNGKDCVVLRPVVNDLAKKTLFKDVPDWFSIPKYVIYEGLERDSIDFYLDAFFNQDFPNHIDTVYEINSIGSITRENAVETIKQRFFDMRLDAGIPVPSGWFLGHPDYNQSDQKYKLSIYMKHDLDGDVYINPAFYHLHLEAYFTRSTSSLHSEFKEMRNAGVTANGVVRFVKKAGGPNRYTSIKEAINDADAYDSILILDNETYTLDEELYIDKPVHIGAYKDDIGSTFPKIDGDHQHRGFHIKCPDESNGVVSLYQLEILNCEIQTLPIYSGLENPDAGSGILINDTDRAYISHCHVHHCVAHYNNRRNLVDEIIKGYSGFGGGILCYHSSAYIYNNNISANQSANGGGIGVFGYGWPVITKNTIAENESMWGGRIQKDGGGIAVSIAWPDTNELASYLSNVINRPWTDIDDYHGFFDDRDIQDARRNRVKIIGNTISHNKAKEDGGGLYLSVMSKSILKDNQIFQNKAGGAGGGVRASMVSDIRISGGSIHHNESNGLTDNGKYPHCPSNGGGGIAIRNCSATLIDVEISENTAHGWAGGGLFYSSSTSGRMGVWLASINWDIITTHIYRSNHYTEYELNISGNTQIHQNMTTWIDPTSQELNEESNCIQNGVPLDRRKGGGVYILRSNGDANNRIPRGIPIQISIPNMYKIKDNQQTVSYSGSAGRSINQDYKDFYFDDLVTRAGNPLYGQYVSDQNGDRYEGTIQPHLTNRSFTY